MTDRTIDMFVNNYKAQVRKISGEGMTKEQAEYLLRMEQDKETTLHIAIAVSLLAHIRVAHKVLED